MSSGGVDVAVPVPVPVPQLYFCHQCSRNVSITLRPNDELICPTCNSGFLEEVEENPNPSPDPNTDFFPHPLFPLFSVIGDALGGASDGGMRFSQRSSAGSSVDPFREFFAGPTSFNVRQRVGVSPAPAPAPQDPDDFNPFAFLQEYMSTFRAGGAEFRFVINGHEFGDPAFHMPANLGDYFVGPGFEQLIQQLAENDPNRYGTPPASKSAVEALPTIQVDETLLKSELAQCAVCKDDFEKGMEVKQMPCKHVYHSDCILPWLELHSSCPVCRYELPTDDPDYQSGGGNSGDAGGSGGGGNPSAQSQARERRYNTIRLNWPFGYIGGDGGSSDGNNDGVS